MKTEVTRWHLEKVDQRNGLNTNKYYKIYVLTHPKGTPTECRWWGRNGTSGQWDAIEHASLQDALDSAATKAYAELGKGYKELSQETYEIEWTQILPSTFTPNTFDKAYRTFSERQRDLGLSNSEIDLFTRTAQMVLADLQDPKAAIDIDRIHEVKKDFHRLKTQFERADITMKMIDILAGQKVLAKTS